MTDILIIGAGVAGMAAAEQLVRAGHTPRLIDKARRPGGRCATRRVDAAQDADWFDYGAQYFTVREDAFRRIVDADLATGRLTHWTPKVALAEQVVGTWLVSPSPDERERLIGPSGLNGWVRERLEAARLTVETERLVQSVAAEDNGWRVVFENGDAETAPAVLLTPPAAQSAALLGQHAGSIDPLAAADSALSACHSVVVEAPPLVDTQAIFFKSGRLSWVADNTHKAGRLRDRHLWTLHADADYSDAHVDTPAAELADELIAEFAAATAQSPLDISLVRSHRWRYARPGRGAPDEEQICWVDKGQRLALAGDWLAGGRVEGAWLSGHIAALRLIDALAGA
ncbi:NAD(P)-binding protein [Salinisphaera sp. SPP-AMP-43]|uniref:NAD(P)/FAD-dependent oxidoreductase n=1 Tax=Salinisphaera sp. SPP-AMP-43 TaxID=3121288 RepID=UPI003C6E3C12